MIKINPFPVLAFHYDNQALTTYYRGRIVDIDPCSYDTACIIVTSCVDYCIYLRDVERINPFTWLDKLTGYQN